jgi:23S rRNA (adenine2503-C2)-methyltransferase
VTQVTSTPSPARVLRSAYDLSLAELAALLGDQPGYRVRQVWDGLHRRALRPAEMTDLPLALRARLTEVLPAPIAEASSTSADGGDTTKWLWELWDGRRVETVLMAYPDRVTVCVSTQAGCAMGCTFCATGQGGFDRQLSAGEIVEQVVAAVRAAAPRRISNVVFMGMGEPLANYGRTWAAIERIHTDLGISARKLTVSTVGLVPGIRRLAHAPLPVNLAVSLHAANDALRDRLVPINRRYPLAALAAACAEYVEATGRRLSIEWALIEGTNDSLADMGELAAFARPLGAHVNLIPLNPTPGFAVQGSSRRQVGRARAELERLGVRATVRSTRGVEIQAACGQLASRSVGSLAVVSCPPVR